jgi:hypothetical protein
LTLVAFCAITSGQEQKISRRVVFLTIRKDYQNAFNYRRNFRQSRYFPSHVDRRDILYPVCSATPERRISMIRFIFFAAFMASLSANYIAAPFFEAKIKAASSASRAVDYAVIAKGVELDPIPDHGVAPPPPPSDLSQLTRRMDEGLNGY